METITWLLYSARVFFNESFLCPVRRFRRLSPDEMEIASTQRRRRAGKLSEEMDITSMGRRRRVDKPDISGELSEEMDITFMARG